MCVFVCFMIRSNGWNFNIPHENHVLHHPSTCHQRHWNLIHGLRNSFGWTIRLCVLVILALFSTFSSSVSSCHACSFCMLGKVYIPFTIKYNSCILARFLAPPPLGMFFSVPKSSAGSLCRRIGEPAKWRHLTWRLSFFSKICIHRFGISLVVFILNFLYSMMIRERERVVWWSNWVHWSRVCFDGSERSPVRDLIPKSISFTFTRWWHEDPNKDLTAQVEWTIHLTESILQDLGIWKPDRKYWEQI